MEDGGTGKIKAQFRGMLRRKRKGDWNDKERNEDESQDHRYGEIVERDPGDGVEN